MTQDPRPTTLRQKIKAAAEFDKELYPLHKDAGTVTMGRFVGAEDEHARLAPLIDALAEVADCLDELNDILKDREAREQIDSLTGQPARKALAKLHDVLESPNFDQALKELGE